MSFVTKLKKKCLWRTYILKFFIHEAALLFYTLIFKCQLDMKSQSRLYPDLCTTRYFKVKTGTENDQCRHRIGTENQVVREIQSRL
ncbi:hypothetical protein Hanom_Chr01g00064381 [Helianthus anomalus]